MNTSLVITVLELVAVFASTVVGVQYLILLVERRSVSTQGRTIDGYLEAVAERFEQRLVRFDKSSYEPALATLSALGCDLLPDSPESQRVPEDETELVKEPTCRAREFPLSIALLVTVLSSAALYYTAKSDAQLLLAYALAFAGLGVMWLLCVNNRTELDLLIGLNSKTMATAHAYDRFADRFASQVLGWITELQDKMYGVMAEKGLDTAEWSFIEQEYLGAFRTVLSFYSSFRSKRATRAA